MYEYESSPEVRRSHPLQQPQSVDPPEYTVSVYVGNKLSRILRHSMSRSRALFIAQALAESDPAIECVIHDGARRTIKRIQRSKVSALLWT